MSEKIQDRIARKLVNLKIYAVKAVIKWAVKKLDSLSTGSFLCFSWGVDDVTDYHVIAERSYSDHHIYGTKVTYYFK